MGFSEHWHIIRKHAERDLAQVKPSFTHAYEHGHNRELAIKGGGVVMGALLMGQGVHQFVKGITESVPGTQDTSTTQMNYTRMFVGLFTAFAGTTALYLAACKSIIPAR